MHAVHATRASVAILALSAGCADDVKSRALPPTHPESAATLTASWVREEFASPGSITFDEIHYHSPSGEELEWIELHNPMAIDMDLSGWSIQGGISYAFGEGTVMEAGGFLVVAADPARMSGALGPYEGGLANDGERLDLRNNAGRLIDTVAYGQDDPWPVHPDGSGLSLAKFDPDAASDHAENWTASTQIGGTPGAPNLVDPFAPSTTLELVALEAEWAYDISGRYPAENWAAPDHDDSGWDVGQAIFFAGATQSDVLATAWVTADNYYAAYLGHADGSDLRLVGPDPDGDWTSVEGFDLEVTPQDHLYLAAWEASGDSGGPQMAIAEVDFSDDVVGTTASTFEWVLGPSEGFPGIPPSDPPPSEASILLLIEEANDAASWSEPAVEADRTSGPWGWALSGAFSEATKYIWADTFSDISVTNTEDTYAVFRSREPLLAAPGSTELPSIPILSTFRTAFNFDADPASTELALDCLIDDGAIVYLNGVEVLRQYLPAGPVDATTLATAPAADPPQVYADIPTDALVRGQNVLAVEVHQALPADPDMTFGCALTARVSPEVGDPPWLLNEIAAATDSPFWVELIDRSLGGEASAGLVLASSAGGELVLPEFGSGDLRFLENVGFALEPGDVLFLYSSDRSTLFDAVRVQARPRGREGEAGPWRFPSEGTPGELNVIDLAADVVIHEIQYHRSPRSVEGDPVTANSEEWIELYNRGVEDVDLGGWQLVDAVAYAFPPGTRLAAGAYLVVAGDAAAVAADHPEISVVGNFSGRLDNRSDRILLLDASGNPADEVRYFDGGRWPKASDGGGSSLELLDPRADNSVGGSWGASSEGAGSEWASYRYRAEAAPSAVGPDGNWEELVLGLLDAGEVLIDDLSVIQDPDTAPVEVIRNGTFDDGESWRLLGNHRHSEVVSDPDNPANSVLRLLATGAAGHMHNHAETTLLRPITTTEYEISFNARWISGSNQVHSRLYFNRMPHTTKVTQSERSGTPGAPNSTGVANLGPTFADLRQDVAVPSPFESVRVTVSADDPDGVEAVTLWTSVEGSGFQSQGMTESAPGEWEAWIEGQAAGTIVQFYVEAEDGLASLSTFPAAGPDSRALIKFDDGKAATNGLHNFRILLVESDSAWLHDDVNLMSDDLVGGTVVVDENEVFYDVGVRAKGSERGRPEVARLGYGVSFPSDHLFRGSHSSVLIDRSEGVGYGQREVLMNLVMTRAASVSGEYNDLTQALTPLPEHTGPAELQLDRFSDLVLAAQFEDGDSGTLFEYELIYFPLTTNDGTAEGFKLPQPDSVIGTSLTDLGEDAEAYRWNFLIQNNERQDDYSRLMDLAQTFSLSGAAFLVEVEDVIDVDHWLRAFAFATLSGAVDNYGSDGSQHNARFYVRPEDQRVLYFPHDLDFFGSSSMTLVGNGDLARLLDDPLNRRSYYGHLQDIVERAYNADYLAPWCEQMAALLPQQDVAGNCQFITDRADWVMNESPDAVLTRYPEVEFRITTGTGLSVASTELVIEGEAWVDLRQVVMAGLGTPLELTWIDDVNWQVVVPLENGRNDITLFGTDLHGGTVGSDSIVVTSTAGG